MLELEGALSCVCLCVFICVCAGEVLLRVASPAEGILVDLLLDLLGRVRDVDAAVGVTRAHLRARTLQGGEELRVDQRRLAVPKPE